MYIEKVFIYIYYPNGQLRSIVGEKDGIVYPYLAEVGYSESGQIAYRKLGNNSEHRYFYDSKDRLQTSVLHLNGVVQSENHYSYDKVDNVTSIVQSSEYTQRYSYDDLNRLIAASGYDNTAVGTPQSAYIMTMEYNKMSSPVNFTQVISSLVNPKSTTYSYHYNNDSQPNAPVQIGDMYYTYDAAGNPTSILDANGIGKDMVWDAENRLRSIADSQEGLYHSYAYDHTGERILKRYGYAQNAYINGEYVGTLYNSGENYSAYVSPYFVETNNGYTKHYYAGATRLVSKIGEGVYKDSTYISYGEEEKDQYFYFQDHLGSSTYITTPNGEVAQYAAYTPYGELFREYRNVTPYKFNGKELDAETGLYYYGARYYNPGTALWLGVDPLAYTNPYVSPYVYCLSNPINLIDPDGRKEYSYSEATKNWDKFDTKNDEIKLDAICIKGTPIQYDQPYGQTITGGMGDGVKTTSKYKGPSIDASQFSYPFGGGYNNLSEFLYNLLSRFLSITLNSNKENEKTIKQEPMKNEIRQTYKTNYSIEPQRTRTTVFGSGATSTEVLEWDTISKIKIILYFNANDEIIKTDSIYEEYK